MKRICKLLVCTIILSLCLTLCASAISTETVIDKPIVPLEEHKIQYATISDDCKTIYYNGHTYSPIDTSNLSYYSDYSYTYDDYDYDSYNNYYADDYYYIEVLLSDEQQQELTQVDLSDSGYTKTANIILNASIYYFDGSLLNRDFIRNDYKDSFEKVINNKDNFSYIVDFSWPDGNIVNITEDVLFENNAEMAVVNMASGYYYEEFYVTAISSDEEFSIDNGYIFFDYDNEAYYVNYLENNISNSYDLWEYDYETGEYPVEDVKYKVHQITDEATLEALRSAQTKYNQEMGIGFFDDGTTKLIAIIFLSLILGVLPLVVAVVAFIFMIIKKGVYKKLFATIFVLSTSEIIVFIISAILIFGK